MNISSLSTKKKILWVVHQCSLTKALKSFLAFLGGETKVGSMSFRAETMRSCLCYMLETEVWCDRVLESGRWALAIDTFRNTIHRATQYPEDMRYNSGSTGERGVSYHQLSSPPNSAFNITYQMCASHSADKLMTYALAILHHAQLSPTASLWFIFQCHSLRFTSV